MPELADEARDTSDEAKEPLLAEAATLWADSSADSVPDAGGDGVAPPGDPGGAVGDLPGFLGAYYRLFPTEVLATAGPWRIAAVAAWHAALGASRPQGRAVVEVRDAGEASLTGAGTVVDIITDDMPYLVDSVTMELNRHSADIRLIVHPLLTARRDVTGVAHGIGFSGVGAKSSAGKEIVSDVPFPLPRAAHFFDIRAVPFTAPPFTAPLAGDSGTGTTTGAG